MQYKQLSPHCPCSQIFYYKYWIYEIILINSVADIARMQLHDIFLQNRVCGIGLMILVSCILSQKIW